MENKLEVPIIWEGKHILVINKPAGLLSLPDGFDPSKPHVKSVLASQYGPLWVVHRLDRFTSGVMVLPRNAIAHRHLNTQFQERQVKKSYRALVHGNPAWDSIRVDQPLSSNIGHRNRTVVDLKNGKPAETRLDVLHRFGNYTLIAASPKTGRRHQIRAHLACLGHSIVGDNLYGGEESFQNTDYSPVKSDSVGTNKLILGRPGLHAKRLELIHPSTNKWVVFEASYPSDLQTTIDNLIAQID
jgi:RluA family pseudouridine synthase